MNCRPELGGDEALAEDVVGKVGQTFKFMFGQFDALRGAWVRCVAMKIDVTEPDAGWYVLFKVEFMSAENGHRDTGSTHRRRASKRSLESCQDHARGAPGRCSLV